MLVHPFKEKKRKKVVNTRLSTNLRESPKKVAFRLSFKEKLLSKIDEILNWVARKLRIPSKYRNQYLIIYGLVVLLILIISVYLAVLVMFAIYGADLPSPDKLSVGGKNSTIFYDRDGKVIYEMYKDKNRIPVKINQISKYLKLATVAIEDKNFYHHDGFDQMGILRAALSTLFGNSQGASTITQQLVKNTMLTNERTFSRKIRELILAVEVERRYNKDQILQMYLNEIPYGGEYWGIGSASKAYFNKKPADLNLVESAILAGLPQNPSKYSPFVSNKGWKDRAKDVLRRMREDNYITRNQEEQAIKDLDKIKFAERNIGINAPQFVFYAQDEIEKLFKETHGKEYGRKLIEQGVRVKTTLSLPMQKDAQKIVHDEIVELKDYKVGNGAAVILDSQTSEILVMVGSYDFNDAKYGKFNVVTANRQPGSTLKPIVYAVGLEQGYTAGTLFMDVKTEFQGQGPKNYVPNNYDGKFRGPVQLRYALANSLNVTAVKMLAMTGVRNFMKKAESMGLTTLAPTDENLNRYGLSIALGGGDARLIDLASAYSVFARGGLAQEPRSVLEITDFDGKVLYKAKPPRTKEVISPEISFIISDILADDAARSATFGVGSLLNIPGKIVAVKTGTTDDKRDNWTVGFTKGVTIATWVGNNDNSPMNPRIASGVTGASPIWNKLMKMALNNYGFNDGFLPKPSKVKRVEIDAFLGDLPKEGSTTRYEYFVDGTEPKDVSRFYKKVKVSKANGKIANEVELRSGNYEEKDCVRIEESDPISWDGVNRWQLAVDAWVKSKLEGDNKDERFNCPNEVSEASIDSVIVSIKNPNNESNLSGGSVKVEVKIVSIEPLKNVEVFLNNDRIKNFDGDKREFTENFNVSDGVYTLRVRAVNQKDKVGEDTVKFGMNKPWNYVAPTDTPVPPTFTPTPTIVSNSAQQLSFDSVSIP